jgi:hypothetical protein
MDLNYGCLFTRTEIMLELKSRNEMVIYINRLLFF